MATRVCMICAELHGTYYYRALLPKRYIDAVHLKEAPNHEVEALVTHLWCDPLVQSCDVLFIERPTETAVPIERVREAKTQGCPIVVDMDDNLFEVPSWSPASRVYRRWKLLDYYRELLRLADFVTTTSPVLGRCCRDWAPQARVAVIPNAIDTDIVLLKPEGVKLIEGDIPTIGWLGGGQHGEDLHAIEPVVLEGLKRGWRFVFMGAAPEEFADRPGVQCVDGARGQVELYYQLVPFLGLDVALAPLIDCEFNSCKSDIKVAEYGWLAGCPVVASYSPPYYNVHESDYFRRLEGFDPKTWLSAIESGLETMRSKGRQYRIDSYNTLTSTGPKWIDVFRAAADKGKTTGR